MQMIQWIYGIIYNCKKGEENKMIERNVQKEMIELRESTGMNRREFCDYFGIPYRTVTEWELGNRKMPDYVLRMMEYQVRMEKLSNKQEEIKKDEV